MQNYPSTISFPHKGLKFNQKFQKKYLVTIDSELNIGGMVSPAIAEIKWLLTLCDIYGEAYGFELITLDHTLVKADSGFMEIHKLVLQMQKALNEISFNVNLYGDLTKVKNLEKIKERWKSVKHEAMEYNRGMTSIQELFSLQDGIFESTGGVESMIKEMEFFNIYFNGFYGKSLPATLKKSVPNLFRTMQIPFSVSCFAQRISAVNYIVSLEGHQTALDMSLVNKTYRQFSFFKIEEIRPSFEYQAEYEVNVATGIIERAKLLYKEHIHEQLGGYVKYKIESYE